MVCLFSAPSIQYMNNAGLICVTWPEWVNNNDRGYFISTGATVCLFWFSLFNHDGCGQMNNRTRNFKMCKFVSWCDHRPRAIATCIADFAAWAEKLLVTCVLGWKVKAQLWIISRPNESDPQWLTHWGRDKMDVISQTTFSSTFSWMKMFEFRLKVDWSLFLRVELTLLQHWFR